ncbi:uncharacterized protein G2W53_010482 [Senna tora]|uniref:Uncharacterized protein n=1 Tax=Senna tora TaxID=362788 RepID=A0A834X020_9FABA|nr:uncharacterized protein G2W53_010482 [Senna tora]
MLHRYEYSYRVFQSRGLDWETLLVILPYALLLFKELVSWLFLLESWRFLPPPDNFHILNLCITRFWVLSSNLVGAGRVASLPSRTGCGWRGCTFVLLICLVVDGSFLPAIVLFWGMWWWRISSPTAFFWTSSCPSFARICWCCLVSAACLYDHCLWEEKSWPNPKTEPDFEDPLTTWATRASFQALKHYLPTRVHSRAIHGHSSASNSTAFSYPALVDFANLILGRFGFGLRWREIGFGLDLSEEESSESRGRSSSSWPEEEEDERERRDDEEMEMDSQSESFNKGMRPREEASNEEDEDLENLLPPTGTPGSLGGEGAGVSGGNIRRRGGGGSLWRWKGREMKGEEFAIGEELVGGKHIGDGILEAELEI